MLLKEPLSILQMDSTRHYNVQFWPCVPTRPGPLQGTYICLFLLMPNDVIVASISSAHSIESTL